MELTLKRIHKGEDYTIGELYINGVFLCHTLEDKVRLLNSYEDKIYGETAIPIGRYKIILSYSNHFKMILPELLNVDFFKYIRMHTGNDKSHTAGCILVGECKDINEGKIYNSKKTLKKLMDILKPANDKNEEIHISIQ
jgi:hypothetical protein